MMNILLIEDEDLAAEDLSGAIQKAATDVAIVAVLASVKESVQYLTQHEHPDLIFCDIQLGDGLSFEIFDAVRVLSPVIFCTAYDEYALSAFKSNGIDYLLKPVTEKAVSEALQKYYALQQNFTSNLDLLGRYKNLLDKIAHRPVSILVNYRDKIIPLPIQDIALFYIMYEETYLLTFSRQSFSVNKPLEELEQLVGERFFRANRQYLVNRSAVKHVSHAMSRKLVLQLTIAVNETITVSKEKSPLFLSWLAGIK